MIDDEKSHTLASASTRAIDHKVGSKVSQAAALGKKLAEAAKKIGIHQALFDKGAYEYHGRIKALAESLRHAGLKI